MSKAEMLVVRPSTTCAAIEELLKMGKRAYVRSDDARARALRERGVDVAVGDFTDLDAVRAAMEGVKSAYFLYPIAPGLSAPPLILRRPRRRASPRSSTCRRSRRAGN